MWESAASGGLQTDLFETTTGRFVISYEFPLTEEDTQPTLHVSVEDESGQEITVNTALAVVAGGPPGSLRGVDTDKYEFVVDAEPGSYRLDVTPSDPDRRYALTVEECGVPSSGEA